MILSASQSRRFRRLFESFIIFCAARLGVDIIVAPDRWLAQKDIDAVFDAIVAKSHDISGLVAAYVEANPDHLNRTDLREVSQWSDALHAGFAFFRDGADTYLIFGDLAFAVRGITGESDLSEQDSDFVQTIIVPFDGVLTFALSRIKLNVPLPGSAYSAVEEKLMRAREERKVIRTARQYHAKVASVFDLPRAGMKKELLELALADVADGQETPTNHVGVLAGLSWDEREAAMREWRDSPSLKESLARFARSDLDREALKGAPASSWKKMLDRHSTADLRRLAQELALVEDAGGMVRSELLPLILEATPMDVEGILWPAIMRGTERLDEVRAVFEAGGRMEAERDSVWDRDDLPLPIFPAMQLYIVGDTYHLVMCDEVLEVLAGADWDALMRRAKTYDDVAHFFEFMLGTRGIARLEDAFRECAEHMRVDESATDILFELEQRMEDGRAGFFVDEYEGEPWFRDILYDEFMHESRVAPEMSDLVAFHERTDPRPLDDMLPYRWISDWLEQFDETRALVAFLDAHVPDNDRTNDYHFAERVIEDLEELGREPLSPEVMDDAFSLLEEYGLVVEGDEREMLRCLIVDFMDCVPKWVYNGWSARELRERSGASSR